MNNLKRVLSLGLAGTMLAGMMMVGAGAVNGKDFTDQDEIKHSEAVNTLVTLNVIAGKDTGAYDPAGSLTRAEMAKLIVYTLNGGKEPVLSTKAVPTYSDIKGHWAEKYIEYCSNLKIVSGQGDGTFNPDGTLTGAQAAKMMLVSMNYDANVFGFTGMDWELSVNSEANKAKLYKDLSGMDPSATITRDEAAQLMYNGILAGTMTKSWDQNMSTGEISQGYTQNGASLFHDKFDGVAYEGILNASGKYAISGSSHNKDYFDVTLKKQDNLELTNPATSGYPALDTNKSFKYADQDLTALAGEYVKVLYNEKDKAVYGVYRVADKTTVIDTTTNMVDENKTDYIKIDGVKYDKDSAFVIYGAASIDTNSADTLKVVDNNGDGKMDLAIVQKVGVAKVTFVGSDSITLALKGGNATLKASNQKTDDMIVYDGIAKNDYVLFSKDLYSDKDKLEKVDLVAGKITGVGSADSKYLIDGDWYKKATVSDVYSSPAVNDTVKMITVGSKIYYMEKTSGAQSVENLAMLITGSDTDTVNGGQAKLLFSDGTKKVVSVASGSVGAVADANVGKMYSYEINNSNEYELTEATTTAWSGAAKMGDYTFHAAGTLDLDADTVDSSAIADNAVVFVSAISSNNSATTASPKLNAGNDGKIMTGKELKALSTGTTDTTIFATAKGYFTSASNGLTRATILCVTLGKETTNGFDNVSGQSSNNYGYLVSDATYTKENGTSYIAMSLWNGDETVDVKWAKSDASSAYTSYTKHTVIGYDTKSDSEITNVSLLNGANNPIAKVAITGLEGKDISFNAAVTVGGASKAAGSVFKLTGDTKYLYVNSGADKSGEIGVAGGSVQTANKPAAGLYVQNAKVVGKLVGSELQVELLVYDVNNQLADRTANATLTTIPSGASLIVNDTTYEAGTYTNGIKIATGDTLKLKADAGKTATFADSNSKIVTNFASDPLATVANTAIGSGTTTEAVTSLAFTVTDGTGTLTITVS